MLRTSSWIVRGVAASAVALFGAGVASANQFVGDLVYCEVGGERGVYEPDAGDYALDGVEVTVRCTGSTGGVCDYTATTGTYHETVDAATFDFACQPFADYDLADPAARAGRYVVNVATASACNATLGGSRSCTVTVNPATLPADCDALVSPTIDPELPADGNGDGDYCDAAEDGPFVEGQILGDNGVNQAVCEALPSIPGDGVHEYFPQSPLTSTRCSLYNDFGFEKDEPECVPCVPRKHTCDKRGKKGKHDKKGKYSHASWYEQDDDPHGDLPTCPASVGSDPKRLYTPSYNNPSDVTYCPVDDSDEDDHHDGRHWKKHKNKHKKHWSYGKAFWGWGWSWR
jgi:hypothetical protein